jgi:hypothetical protein
MTGEFDANRSVPALLEQLQAAEETFARNPAGSAGHVRSLLAQVEDATPGGAPLHSQLDNVRKWLDALDRPDDYARFGGANHIRDYVLTQIRLARGALEDYHREM